MFVRHVSLDVCGGAAAVVAQRTGEVLAFAAHVHAQVPFHVRNAEELLAAVVADEIERIEFC